MNTADTDRLSITEQYSALEEAFANGELTHKEFRRIERELVAAEDAASPDAADLVSLETAYRAAREQLRAVDPDGLAAWEMGR